MNEAAKKIQRYYRGYSGRKIIRPMTENQYVTYMHDFPKKSAWLETTIDVAYMTKPIPYEQIHDVVQEKLREMTRYIYWAYNGKEMKEAMSLSNIYNTLVGYWKGHPLYGDSKSRSLRFYVKRCFRVRFEGTYNEDIINPIQQNNPLRLKSLFVYIKPVGSRKLNHINEKTVAGFMTGWNFKDFIKNKRIGSYLRFSRIINFRTGEKTNEEFSNTEWNSTIDKKPTILEQVAKMVLGMEDIEEEDDNMGWNEINLSTEFSDLLHQYDDINLLSKAVKLINKKIIMENKILKDENDNLMPVQIEEAYTPDDVYENVLKPYWFSMDQDTRETKIGEGYDWRLVWPITDSEFRDGEDIIFSNEKAHGDMLQEIMRPIMKKHQRQERRKIYWYEKWDNELEMFEPELKF